MTNYNILGYCYRSDVTTTVSNLNIYLTNVSTGDSLNGDSYPDLKTDSNGQWAVNLADLPKGWSVGDSIKIEANHSDYGKDIVTLTVSSGAGESCVKIVLQSLIHFNVDRAIDELGETFDYRTVNSTQDTEYFGSITAESTSDTTIKGVFKADDDTSFVDVEGVKRVVNAKAVVRTRDSPAKDNLIRIPRTTGAWYRIKDEPLARREANETMFYVITLVLVNAS